MINKTNIFILFLISMIVSGCQRTKVGGYEKSWVFKLDKKSDSQINRHVAMDEYIYPFANTNEGYEKAGKELKNPLPLTEENLDKGKNLYLQYCKQCHGLNGKSDAPMINSNKFPPPPNYSNRIKTITAGKMFHSITWGKNLMPSFKNDISPDERWSIIYYVRQLAGVKDSIR